MSFSMTFVNITGFYLISSQISRKIIVLNVWTKLYDIRNFKNLGFQKQEEMNENAENTTSLRVWNCLTESPQGSLAEADEGQNKRPL